MRGLSERFKTRMHIYTQARNLKIELRITGSRSVGMWWHLDHNGQKQRSNVKNGTPVPIAAGLECIHYIESDRNLFH